MSCARAWLRVTIIPAILPFLVAAFASQFAGAREAKSTVVSWQPTRLVRGSPVLFQVNAARVQSISGEWMGHKLNFFCYENGTRCYALGAVPIETKPGSYELHLIETFAARSAQLTKKVSVFQAKYPRIAAHVAKKFTEPNPEQLKQIATDKDVKQAVLAIDSPDRLWSGQFTLPVSVPVSDIFGTERVFNGQVQSRHLGLDFAAPAGTPVRAINNGTVLLAQPLYFEGGFVVIDHGQGLLSLYLHLSDFQVRKGDPVVAGQIIGVSGSSGRATGPHLHLAIRWQGIYLDPAVLLHLRMP